MIDYARVAQLLKEVDSFIDTADAPRLHSEYVEALTAAYALCEAHAAPVDEDALRDDFEEHVLPTWMPRDRFDDGIYKVPDANSRWHAYRVARARSDARTKVAEQWQPIESAPKDGTYFIAYSDKSVTITHHLIHWSTDFLEQNEAWRDAGGYEYDYLTHWQPLPPPPTIEGDRG